MLKGDNYILLDSFPRKNGKIDWSNSVGSIAPFCYKKITGEIEVVGYEKKNIHYLKIKYNNIITNIDVYRFQKCEINKLFKRYSGDYLYDKGEKLNYIEIIDREKRLRESNNQNEKWYKYKCGCCNNEKWIVENSLKRGARCNFCKGDKTRTSKYICDSDKWMIKYFQDKDKHLIYSNTSNSTLFINPICPDCGNIKSKPMKINWINTRKSISCICGDGFSYPEKVMYLLLKQLNLDFEIEYSPKWIAPKRYDFYIPSLGLIIEMDGEFHYKDNKMNNTTAIENQENDRLKDELANQHGLKVVRIDCRESSLKWIKNNILKSEINRLFDLNIIDWMKCEKFSNKSLVKEVCDYWNQKEEWESTEHVSKMFKLSRNTITNYLKKGSKVGWCIYDPTKEANRILKYRKIPSKKMVDVFKDDMWIARFESISDTKRYGEGLLDVKLNLSCISENIKNRTKTYKGFDFKAVEENNPVDLNMCVKYYDKNKNSTYYYSKQKLGIQ